MVAAIVKKAPASEGGHYNFRGERKESFLGAQGGLEWLCYLRSSSTQKLDLGEAALEREKDEISTAADSKFIEQVGDVKFDGALGDIELAGNLFIGKIFEERIENFLFAAAEIGDGIGFEATALGCEDRIHKARKQLTWNPKSAAGNQRQCADELLARFGVGQESFDAEAEERKAVGLVVCLADDNQAGFRESFEKIGQQRASGGFGGVRVDDVNLSLRRLESAQVGRERGFQLLDDDFELRSLRQQAFEFAQHQRVRREYADRKFSVRSFSRHCSPDCQGRENCPQGQGPWGPVFSNCNVTCTRLFWRKPDPRNTDSLYGQFGIFGKGMLGKGCWRGGNGKTWLNTNRD